MKIVYILLVPLLPTLIVLGCASEQKTAEQKAAAGVSMEAKQLAAEEKAPYVTEFGFAKGSTKLPDAAKTKLNNLITKASAAGKIGEIKVVTWGDSEYPSVHTKKLSKTEVDLVQKRNNSIEAFIAGVSDNASVKKISMAERPGALSELVGTSDAQVKKSLEQAGIPTTDTSVKMPSKSSRSIVIISLE